jgi:hypothetical protein
MALVHNLTASQGKALVKGSGGAVKSGILLLSGVAQLAVFSQIGMARARMVGACRRLLRAELPLTQADDHYERSHGYNFQTNRLTHALYVISILDILAQEPDGPEDPAPGSPAPVMVNYSELANAIGACDFHIDMNEVFRRTAKTRRSSSLVYDDWAGYRKRACLAAGIASDMRWKRQIDPAENVANNIRASMLGKMFQLLAILAVYILGHKPNKQSITHKCIGKFVKKQEIWDRVSGLSIVRRDVLVNVHKHRNIAHVHSYSGYMERAYCVDLCDTNLAASRRAIAEHLGEKQKRFFIALSCSDFRDLLSRGVALVRTGLQLRAASSGVFRAGAAADRMTADLALAI